MAVEVRRPAATTSWLRRTVAVAAAVALLAVPRVSTGQLAAAREYEIKAGFIFNFAKFVDWPDSAFTSASDVLRLEVLGHDPFDGALDRLVAGKTVGKHPVTIMYSSDLSGPRRGHVVFVSGSEHKVVATHLTALAGAPALTISDIDQFAERGGVIGLVTEGQAVKFVINRAAATQAGLRVGSRLLSLATILERNSAARSPAGWEIFPRFAWRMAAAATHERGEVGPVGQVSH